MKKVINRKVYDTSKAQKISCDNQFDLGLDGCSSCTDLYVTEKGNYFLHHRTTLDGQYDSLVAISMESAESFFEKTSHIYSTMSFEDAFPTIKIEEA